MRVCQVCESDLGEPDLRGLAVGPVVLCKYSKFLNESSSSLLIAQYSILFNSKCKKKLFAQH